ncbi:RidA family protein [Shouchella shacheensis]|uniref:RidA family protein n=1 Tax=Shouchella shacheensis TaxID=1649580 RepID=UPI00073FCD1D|nr:RidA family protein [Shouchella shacheensis]
MQIVSTSKAPAAIGPYSQAVKTNNLLFISGQLPMDPNTGNLVENSITLQTKQVMNNIKAILQGEGLTLEQVVKTTIFINDMDQFGLINEEYSQHFAEHKPARATVEVSRLPKDALVEIEAIAAY